MFGSTRKKLKHWEKAGLISADQSGRILDFEKTRKAGKLVKDLTTVGVLAILLGVLSLVATNWMHMPAEVKLGLHFLLNLGLIIFMLRIDGAQKPVIKDVCVLALFGLFLTFIALIGQIYQLHGDLPTTMLFWLAICTPFIWYYGRTYTVAVPWVAVGLTALVLNIDRVVAGPHKDDILFVVCTALAFYLPIILLLASRIGWLLRNRLGFAETFRRAGLYMPAWFATGSMFMFYTGVPDTMYMATLMGLLTLGMLVIFVVFRPSDKQDSEATELWYYLLVSGFVMMLPLAMPDLESGILAAIVFILYWIFIAWLGARMQSSQLMDWAIRLVILRVFIVYLEVFGSLLKNGIGLIVSGIILLVVLKNLNRIVAAGRKLVNYEIR